jgi:transcriptional regulator GlxA family with amidase domain
VEVLFTQIIRAYIAQTQTPVGVLSAMADAKLGSALNAMHQHPEYCWSIESLANVAGMSRTAFSHHFHTLVGQTPMHYLTQWRMQKAKMLLETNNISMLSIAEQSGYQSEAAFSKAFKKCMGLSPGACRRKNQK